MCMNPNPQTHTPKSVKNCVKCLSGYTCIVFCSLYISGFLMTLTWIQHYIYETLGINMYMQFYELKSILMQT